MFCLSTLVLASVAIVNPQELEDEEVSLSEKVSIVDQDEATDDGELVFDEEEPVAELED